MLVLASTLSLFTNSLPPDVKVNALYLDEGNFTADVASDTKVELFYSMLVDKCPKEVILAALPSTGLNNRTLISGTINLSIQDFVQATPFSNVDVEKEITALASDVGIQLINVNVGQSRLVENIKNTDIFIKVEGSFLQCQAFFEGMVEKNWYLRVSKILFMPTTGHNATLVLRFQKVESVLS
jgi:Tfp pilus assembly protein PilO